MIYNKYISNTLKKKGFKFIGSGVDQHVYGIPSEGYVVKIIEADSWNRTQEMIETWVKFCQKNKRNKFLPKFKGVAYFEDPDGEVHTQVIAERLNKIPMKLKKAICSSDFYRQNYDKYYMKKVLDPKDQALFFKTIDKIHEICEDYDYEIDLHAGNFLMRGDQLVINDPFTT